MARLFDPKAFLELQNAMAQAESLILALNGLRTASAAAKEILIAVGNAEEAQAAAEKERDELQSEVDGLTAERVRLHNELQELAARKQAALKASMDALEALK